MATRRPAPCTKSVATAPMTSASGSAHQPPSASTAAAEISRPGVSAASRSSCPVYTASSARTHPQIRNTPAAPRRGPCAGPDRGPRSAAPRPGRSAGRPRRRLPGDTHGPGRPWPPGHGRRSRSGSELVQDERPGGDHSRQANCGCRPHRRVSMPGAVLARSPIGLRSSLPGAVLARSPIGLRSSLPGAVLARSPIGLRSSLPGAVLADSPTRNVRFTERSPDPGPAGRRWNHHVCSGYSLSPAPGRGRRAKPHGRESRARPGRGGGGHPRGGGHPPRARGLRDRPAGAARAGGGAARGSRGGAHRARSQLRRRAWA